MQSKPDMDSVPIDVVIQDGRTVLVVRHPVGIEHEYGLQCLKPVHILAHGEDSGKTVMCSPRPVESSSVVLLPSSSIQSSIASDRSSHVQMLVPVEDRRACHSRDPAAFSLRDGRCFYRGGKVDGLLVRADHNEVGCIVAWLSRENEFALPCSLSHASILDARSPVEKVMLKVHPESSVCSVYLTFM